MIIQTSYKSINYMDIILKRMKTIEDFEKEIKLWSSKDYIVETCRAG